MKVSNCVVSISGKSRNSNNGTERCELYIFSVASFMPPMEPSMLSSNCESRSLVVKVDPPWMPWIQDLIFTVAGGLVARLLNDRAANLLLGEGADAVPEQYTPSTLRNVSLVRKRRRDRLHNLAIVICFVARKRVEKGEEVARDLRFHLVIDGVELGSRHKGYEQFGALIWLEGLTCGFGIG